MPIINKRCGSPVVSGAGGGGGGGSHTSGLYVNIPASPTAGDSYEIIDSDPTCPGCLFYCGISGTWVYVGSAVFVDDFSSGWTAYYGTGSVSIATGALSLTSAAGTQYRVGGYGYDGPCAYRTIPTSATSFDIAFRLLSVDDIDRTPYELEIADAVSGNTGIRISVQANRTSGNVLLYQNNANITHAVAANRFPVYDGQQWVRLTVGAGNVTALTGVGVAGNRPTSWLDVGSVALSATWASVAIGLMSVGTAAPTTAVASEMLLQFSPPSLL